MGPGRRAAAALAVGLLAVATLVGCRAAGLASTQARLVAQSTSLDIRAENAQRGTTAWRIPASQQGTAAQVAGYAVPPTVTPGQSVRIFVSTTRTSLRAAAYRIGWYGGTGARQYWSSGPLAARHQKAQTYIASTRTVVEKWAPTATIRTSGWPPGVYLVKLTAGTGAATRSRYLTIVVRSTSTRGRTVLMPSLFTSLAYNDFGGRSAYTGPSGFASRAYAASFLRPNSWKTYGQGTGKFLSYERPVIQLAERLGLPLAYESDLDISTVPGILSGARALVTLGHAEYWSVPERNAVEAARNRGTNLIILGANTSYWRVRLAQHNTEMVIYKSAKLDPAYPSATTTTQWRLAPSARPERRLTGLMYDCFPASGTFTVTSPGFWGFAGTGARKGTGYKGILGPEVDEASSASDVPRPLRVVASSRASCGGRSAMVYYTTRSGAGVVTTGTMGWVLHGFSASVPAATRAFVTKVTTTLLREASRGPLGRLHRA